MRGTLAVLLLALGAGCNGILGLDRTHLDGDAAGARPDAAAIDAIRVDGPDAAGCAGIGHDEDGDGIDDGCDLCPQIAGDAQVDSDGDGIGDACDPNPADPNDVLLFFDSFAVPNPWQSTRGDWTVKEDALFQPDDSTSVPLATRMVPDPTAAELTIDVDFTIDAVQPVQVGEVVANRGVGVWFVASNFGVALQNPSGYFCQLVGDVAAASPTSSASLLVVNDDTSSVLLGGAAIAQPVPTGVPGRIRVRRSAGPDHEACHAEVAQAIADLASADTTYTVGIIGVRTIQASIHLTSVTAYGKKPAM